ncbi:MAG: hypothetical protein EXS55_00175 [Candidatus Magasanikbacteria bacterium]|nr:hypothetical protein [Candidatus Magasanikbacteria bacterium]
MKIITEPISLADLKNVAAERFGNMVKAVVDVNQEIMAIGGDLHADEEAVMLEHGSAQENLWGINLYPDVSGLDFLEFDSMINLRPKQNNRSRSVEDIDAQNRIREVVRKLIV